MRSKLLLLLGAGLAICVAAAPSLALADHGSGWPDPVSRSTTSERVVNVVP